MNCTQGDMAIVIAGPKSAGKIVTCIRLADRVEHFETLKILFTHDNPVWVIDADLGHTGLTADDGSKLPVQRLPYCSDKCLRPLCGDLTDSELTTDYNEIVGESQQVRA